MNIYNLHFYIWNINFFVFFFKNIIVDRIDKLLTFQNQVQWQEVIEVFTYTHRDRFELKTFFEVLGSQIGT